MLTSCKFPLYGIKACFNATLDCSLSDSRLRYQGFSMNGQGWSFRKQLLKFFVTVPLQQETEHKIKQKKFEKFHYDIGFWITNCLLMSRNYYIDLHTKIIPCTSGIISTNNH